MYGVVISMSPVHRVTKPPDVINAHTLPEEKDHERSIPLSCRCHPNDDLIACSMEKPHPDGLCGKSVVVVDDSS